MSAQTKICGGLALAIGLCAHVTDAQEDRRPLATRWAVDYSGFIELGVGYLSEDNFEFGEYNGLHEQGPLLIGTLSSSQIDGDAAWTASARNLGLDTREGLLRWQNTRWDLFVEFDSQLQVRNNSGRSVWSGGNELLLPLDWQSGVTTGGFSALGENLRGLDQELERNRYTLGLSARLNDFWSLDSRVFYEEKTGVRDLGAAIFTNVSVGDAAVLPRDVDYANTSVDLALNYARGPLTLSATLLHSRFDNGDQQLVWQNPYANFGPAVRYPDGFGALALEPDNHFTQGRFTGVWRLSPTLRLQLDGSLAYTEQDESLLPFTVNSDLTVSEPLPLRSLDAGIDTHSLDARLFWMPRRGLRLETYFHSEGRDFDVPREGWRYVLGDATAQVGTAGRLFNTAQDYVRNTFGIEGSHKLPWRSKLWLIYEYEEIDRDNAAVLESEEDRFRLRYRLPLGDRVNLRVEALYGDRAADNYLWDQSYFARLDTERINATPDNQRYLNHPQLSQFHLATRERFEGQLDVDWQPGETFNLLLNLLYRLDDYTETDLGLNEDSLGTATLTASWLASDTLSLSTWASYSLYDAEQRGRAFQGGSEKNAFEVFPPLPQASDPSRNWQVDTEDEVVSVGAGLEWTPSERLSLSADYSFMDSTSEFEFSNGGGVGLNAEPLPRPYENRMHHLQLEGLWHYSEQLSLRLDYQYWRYAGDDWATGGVGPNTLDKVLTLGEQPPSEVLHYIGTSVIYRFK